MLKKMISPSDSELEYLYQLLSIAKGHCHRPPIDLDERQAMYCIALHWLTGEKSSERMCDHNRFILSSDSQVKSVDEK
jgi:hypothetical protein